MCGVQLAVTAPKQCVRPQLEMMLFGWFTRLEVGDLACVRGQCKQVGFASPLKLRGSKLDLAVDSVCERSAETRLASWSGTSGASWHVPTAEHRLYPAAKFGCLCSERPREMVKYPIRSWVGGEAIHQLINRLADNFG